VLFGGVDRGDNALGDTWVFDGARWRRVRCLPPRPRRYAAFACCPDLHGCVLHGGSVDDRGEEGFGSTWLFRDGTWEQLPGVRGTDVRDDHGLGYHRAAGVLVMLEGVNGARGLLALGPDGWHPVEATPLHPRHQCAPLAWDDRLDGLVFHGGERHFQGPQLDATWALRLPPLALPADPAFGPVQPG
jgi:hypothetical protein